MFSKENKMFFFLPGEEKKRKESQWTTFIKKLGFEILDVLAVAK